jgi:hypothetical protein
MRSPDHGLRLSAERQQSDVNRSDTRRHTLQKAPPQTVHDIEPVHENRRPDSRIGLSRERRRHDRIRRLGAGSIRLPGRRSAAARVEPDRRRASLGMRRYPPSVDDCRVAG